jgi:hypothetical protein
MTIKRQAGPRRLDFAQLRVDDADHNAFFARSLWEIEQQIYKVEYPELIAKSLIPPKVGVNPAAKTFAYRMFDRFGVAKLLASYAEDLPRSDIRGKEYTVRIEGYGASYGYSVMDIRGAAMAGIPLESEKADAARDTIERTLDEVYAIGDTKAGSKGILNLANVPAYVIPNGAGGSPLWVNKTQQEILADLNGIAHNSASLTRGIERPSRMLLDLDLFALISTTPMFATASDTTILQYFLKNSPYIKEVIPWWRCADAGAAGVSRIVVYTPRPEKVQYLEPQPFEVFPPEQMGLRFQSACHARTGGVFTRYPFSLTYADGAGA